MRGVGGGDDGESPSGARPDREPLLDRRPLRKDVPRPSDLPGTAAPHVTHVIFDGSGIYTPAYAGVAAALGGKRCGGLRVRDLLLAQGIRGVGGVSGGAMMMALVCAGVSTDKMNEMSEIVDSAPISLGGALMGTSLCARAFAMAVTAATVIVAPCCAGPCGRPASLVAASRFYFDPVRAMGDMLVIAGQPRGVTFAELYEDSGLELRVGMADAETHELVIVGHLTTPDMPVATAVAASSAHPAFTSVKAVYWGGRAYIDGIFASHTSSPATMYGEGGGVRTLHVRVVPIRGHTQLPPRHSENPSKNNISDGKTTLPYCLGLPVREQPGEAPPHGSDLVDIGWLWGNAWLEGLPSRTREASLGKGRGGAGSS
jgi:hypothetical protein